MNKSGIKLMSKKDTKRFAWSLTASVISAVVDLLGFTILTHFMPREYWYILLATVIARLFSTLLNYNLVRRWCFEPSENKRREVIFFFALAFIKLFVSANMVAWLATVKMFDKLSPTLLKAIVDIVLAFATFRIQDKYVFGDEKLLGKLVDKH